jgi:hypothetical protein
MGVRRIPHLDQQADAESRITRRRFSQAAGATPASCSGCRDAGGVQKNFVATGLVLPRCNTAAMALHLAEISRTVTPGAHAVLLLDQAGWHLSAKLDVPDNITLMPLPPKSPELNRVENIWQFIRDN